VTSEIPIEQHIVDCLSASRRTLATAESCSGGLISHRLTNVPGASDCLLGGVVAYSNEIKTAILGVDPGVLREVGAVSETVAGQMAEGVRQAFGADFGVGVTGIAGPGGGTEEKPVGLVYIAVASAAEKRVSRNLFEGSRVAVKDQTAQRALEMLSELIG
jgi:nicotinamide-nucleotide amidase